MSMSARWRCYCLTATARSRVSTDDELGKTLVPMRRIINPTATDEPSQKFVNMLVSEVRLLRLIFAPCSQAPTKGMHGMPPKADPKISRSPLFLQGHGELGEPR